MGERMKMKQEKAEALKQTILNVAYELFLTHGYEKVCLADIEQGAGATRGSLIYHYRSKETLLLLTSEKFIADFFRDTCPDEEVINSRTPLKDYLKASVQMVEAQVRHFKENIVKDTKVTSASSINFMIHLCTLSASFKRALQAFHTTQLGYWWRSSIGPRRAVKSARRSAPSPWSTPSSTSFPASSSRAPSATKRSPSTSSKTSGTTSTRLPSRRSARPASARAPATTCTTWADDCTRLPNLYAPCGNVWGHVHFRPYPYPPMGDGGRRRGVSAGATERKKLQP